MIPMRAGLLVLAMIGTPASAFAQASAATAPAPVNEATGYSASALYDLANADARAGKTGLAVLNYERARLLDPADPDIEANLQLVRQAAGLPPETRSRFERIAGSLDSRLLFWVGVAGIVAIGAATLARRRNRSRRRALGAVRALGVLALAAAGCNAAALWPSMQRATVIVHSAAVRVSPVSIGDPAFTVGEAQTVNVRAQRPGFVLIETADGRVGWAASSDVARVVPAAQSN